MRPIASRPVPSDSAGATTSRAARRLIAAALALLVLPACQTSGIGKVPTSIVDLYDRADPEGGIELEIDRDGTIREAEAEIPVSDLPAGVARTAKDKAPGGTILGAERELNMGGACWEVKVEHEGRDWEFVIDDDGNVLEIEKELRRSEAPTAVLEAADREIPGGAFRSVESIEKGDSVEYHVKKTRDGASYKIVLEADGTLIRKVREARAEIEIPLKD